MPGGTLVEDARKSQRENVISRNTPPGDLSGMYSLPNVSSQKISGSSAAEDPDITSQEFPQRSMTGAHRGEHGSTLSRGYIPQRQRYIISRVCPRLHRAALTLRMLADDTMGLVEAPDSGPLASTEALL